MQTYAPGTEIGQYRILSAPMMGGMGIVYICHDLANDRAVALKTFKPEYLPDRAARDRFLREGTAWVELGKHPHIVRCYQVMYIDPTAFLVLELVAKDEGREDASLRSWLGQPLPLETALAFTLQIARGMQHATQKLPGFVHRDLKPENVLVGSDRLPGTEINRLRVTDFGLVAMLKDETGRLKDEEPTAVNRTHLTHGIMGTPLYMAPEQWQGEPVGTYTDVYALGCILYEMLTGERAVSGRSLADLRATHCAGRLRPLPTGLPGEVADFLARSLALAGTKRYQAWEEVIAALEAAYAGLGRKAAPGPIPAPELSREEHWQAASSYIEMGTSYLHMGKAQVALGYYEKALGMFRELGHRQGEAAALGNLGLAYARLGEARRAIDYYEQQLEIVRELGDRQGEGYALGNLGVAYKDLGDPRQSVRYCEQGLVIARKLSNRREEGSSLGNLGLAYMALGEARRAIGYYEQALAISREIGDRRGEGNDLGNLGVAYVALDDSYRAIGYFEQQLEIVCEIGDRDGEGNALGSLGNAHLALGNARRAIEYHKQRLVIAREIGNRRGEGNALGNLGTAYAALSDARHAIGYIEQQMEIVREIGDLMGLANASGNMAILHMQLGDTLRALEYAQESVRIFTQIGNLPKAQRAQKIIDQLRVRAGQPGPGRL